MALANSKFKLEEHPDEWSGSGFGGSPDGGQPTLKRTHDAVPLAEPKNLVNSGHNYSPREQDRTFSSRWREARPRAEVKPEEEIVSEPGIAERVSRPTPSNTFSLAAARVSVIKRSSTEGRIANCLSHIHDK